MGWSLPIIGFRNTGGEGSADEVKPGDYKIFFSDPRTRENYIQWAPLLMAAEEYHAGHRKVDRP